MQPIDIEVFFGLQHKDIIMAAAVILGPILAVQAQKWLEHFREKKKRRIEIFRTLMTTRAEPLHRDHVQALNMIDIDFYGWVMPLLKIRMQNSLEKAVTDAWKVYRNHLNKFHENADSNSWATKRQDLFTDVLYKMAISLNYSFDRVQLEVDAYRPVAYNNLENVQAEILLGLTEVLKGGKSIPMKIVEWPPVSESTAETKYSDPKQENQPTDQENKNTSS
ncbi:hypothetical protein ABNE89_004102 [Yersinia enterocolitica]